MSAKEFEEKCKQPVAIITAVSMLAMVLVNGISMFAFFTKLNTMFNPHQVLAQVKHKKLFKSSSIRPK